MSQPSLFVKPLRKNHRERLQRAVRETDEGKFRDRCRSILWSSERCSCSEIASRLDVHHTTVMRWIQDYQRFGLDGLRVGKSPGRPPKLDEEGLTVLVEALGKHPRDFGYARATWTATLLRDHVFQVIHVYVHPETIRRTLRSIGYRHKRPKLSLKHKQDPKAVRRAKRQRNNAIKKPPQTPSDMSSSIKTSVNSISTPA